MAIGKGKTGEGVYSKNIGIFGFDLGFEERGFHWQFTTQGGRHVWEQETVCGQRLIRDQPKEGSKHH